MPEVAELSREELMNFIASVRGDQVAVLMEIASEEELKTYLQSLVHTAELLGDGIPGLVDPPPEEGEGEGEDPAADAPAATPAADGAPAAPNAPKPAASAHAAAAPQPTKPAQDAAAPQPAKPQQPADGAAPGAQPAPANTDALRQQVMGLLKELAAETKTASPQQLGALRLALRIAKAKMHAEGS